MGLRRWIIVEFFHIAGIVAVDVDILKRYVDIELIFCPVLVL